MTNDAERARLAAFGADLSSRLGAGWWSRAYDRALGRGPAIELRDGEVALELVVDRGAVTVRLCGDPEPFAWIDGAIADDAELSSVCAVLERARTSLTVARLVIGRSYRVTQDTKALRRGQVLRFVHFDDVDNHFGRLVFEDPSGARHSVEGDFSSVEYSVAQVHRYLESIDG